METRDVCLQRYDPEQHSYLDVYDHTILSAMATCPTWGGVTYIYGKRFRGATRSTPLESGAAMHEVFAAVRLMELENDELRQRHGLRLFGERRWSHMLDVYTDAGDTERGLRALAICCLDTSTFEDSPYDRKRTLAALQDAAYAYLRAHEFREHPVYVDERTGQVGIEMGYRMVVVPKDFEPFIYACRIDGLHVHDGGELVPHENKTSSQIGPTGIGVGRSEAWRQSFDTSHQVSGYIMAASMVAGEMMSRAVIDGVAVPQPRSGVGGTERFFVTRSSGQMGRWLWWAIWGAQAARAAREDLQALPMFTHSCNRHFAPCPLIPYCVQPTDEDRAETLAEMEEHKWEPLADVHE